MQAFYVCFMKAAVFEDQSLRHWGTYSLRLLMLPSKQIVFIFIIIALQFLIIAFNFIILLAFSIFLQFLSMIFMHIFLLSFFLLVISKVLALSFLYFLIIFGIL